MAKPVGRRKTGSGITGAKRREQVAFDQLGQKQVRDQVGRK